MSDRFKNRAVLITGAVGGLGQAMAHAFAGEGARVVVTGRKEDQGRELSREIGHGAVFVRLDVTDEASWQSAMEEVERQVGPLSVLINNAAYLAVGGVETVPLGEFRKVIDTNLTGAFLGIRAAAPSMRNNGGGAIVNISSPDCTEPRDWRRTARASGPFEA